MSVWRCVNLYVLKVSYSSYDLTKIAVLSISRRLNCGKSGERSLHKNLKKRWET